MSLAVTYYAGMEWLLGIFTWLGVFAALLTIGEILHRWLREGTQSQLATYLTVLVTGNKTEWLKATNSIFLAAFDRVYSGKWNIWEQAIWYGLLVSPLALAGIVWVESLSAGRSNEPSRALTLALISVGLRDLRRGHRTALDSGDAATARSISLQIFELLDGWVSA